MLRRRNLKRSIAKAVHSPGYAVSVFARRLKAYLSYRLGGGWSTYPETVSLMLTYLCNLRCAMCGQWGEGGWARCMSTEDVSRALDMDTLKRLIDEFAAFRPAITLFGGEPLLFKDWEALVGLIKAAKMRVNIITNGTLLEQHVPALVDLGVDEIIFSLDGPGEVHDAIRGSEGTFDRAMQAFRTLDAYKKKQGRHTPRVNINTTIFETNYHRLGEIIDIADSIGADTVTFHHLIFLSNSICDRNKRVFSEEFGLDCRDWYGFARETLPAIEPDRLIASLREATGRPSRVKATVYPNFTDEEVRTYYSSFEFTSSSYAPRCLSPWMTVYIFPNGDVKPCLDTCFIAGNVRDASFSKIWNDGPLKTYRAAVKKDGIFPGCIRCTELYRA